MLRWVNFGRRFRLKVGHFCTPIHIDEPQSNERITDRILESIKKAEYVIVDLTESRPNVFYEAGFAQGLGKTPIYVAREGTKLEFDLKDYPIIFFRNMKDLKDGLEKRLRGLADSKAATRGPVKRRVKGV